VIIKTDFKWEENSYPLFRKWAVFTCRFTGSDQQVVVPAIMERSPIGAYDKAALPD